MKSRISFFSKTVFLKNLTRFAPCWGLYTVGALLGLVLLLDSGSQWMANNLIDSLQLLGLITPCYALVCTQLLFGDLYNTRMCNALHALPLRRETWFFTNLLSGLVFHLIPTVLLAVLAAPVLILYCPENALPAVPLWFLGANLQFLCFFGIALVSVFCVGTRFAQAVVFAMVNFAAILAGWLLETLYYPHFYGLRMEIEAFHPFSPIIRLMSDDFIDVERIFQETDGVRESIVVGFRYHTGEVFSYYFLLAAIGVALMGLALWLYRRRKLECAGDFIAIKALEPVFLVIYTLILGALFQFFTSDLFGMDFCLFLFVGLAVGWFTGRMLLERSVRVFRKTNLLRCGALIGIMALTLLVAAWDPLGIETWIPDVSQVKSITLYDGHYFGAYRPTIVTLEAPEDIQHIIEIHETALESHRKQISGEGAFVSAYTELVEETREEDPLDFWYSYELVYTLNSGRTVSREYSIWMKEESSQYLIDLLGTPNVVFGCDFSQADFLSRNRSCIIRDTWQGEITLINTPADLQSLTQAVLADCREGNMIQFWEFHRHQENLYWLEFEDGTSLDVFADCEHTLTWLRSHGLDVDGLLELHREMYG